MMKFWGGETVPDADGLRTEIDASTAARIWACIFGEQMTRRTRAIALIRFH